jgi:hypothetical protein
VIAVLSNFTVIHRIVHTWRECQVLDRADEARHAADRQQEPAEEGERQASGDIRQRVHPAV